MVEVIDPDGDVLLVLPAGDFLVSSKVLILSTDYFRRMLTSGWYESLQPLNDPESPARITMRENEHYTFGTLLKITHHQPHDLKGDDFDVAEILRACVVADKYGWVEKLGLILSLSLQFKTSRKLLNSDRALGLLNASWLLRDGRLFRKASAWLARLEPLNLDNLRLHDEHNILPEYAWHNLKLSRVRALFATARSLVVDCTLTEEICNDKESTPLIERGAETKALIAFIDAWDISADEDLFMDKVVTDARGLFNRYRRLYLVFCGETEGQMQDVRLFRAHNQLLHPWRPLPFTSPSYDFQQFQQIPMRQAFTRKLRGERAMQQSIGLCLHCVRARTGNAPWCPGKRLPHA